MKRDSPHRQILVPCATSMDDVLVCCRLDATLARCRKDDSDVSYKKKQSGSTTLFDDFTLAVFKFNFLFHQAAIQ